MRARTVKFVFLLMALALTVLLFTWPTNEERLNISSQIEVQEAGEDLSPTSVGDVAVTIMEAPHFTGEDKKGRRWSVKALRAVQQGDKEGGEQVTLEKVEAFSTLEKGQSLAFSAGEGVLLSTQQKISLHDGVEVKGYGYTLKTDKIEGNLETQYITSSGAVSLTGIKGNIYAGQFEMEGLQGKIVLSKGVKMRLNLNKTEADNQLGE